MPTKAERALEIYKANHTKMTNSEIIAKFEKDLGMSTAGARTYAYNAKKALGAPAKPAKAKVTKKAAAPKKVAKKKVVVKAAVDKKTGKLTVTKAAADPVVSEDKADVVKKNAALFADFHNRKLAEDNNGEPEPYSSADPAAKQDA